MKPVFLDSGRRWQAAMPSLLFLLGLMWMPVAARAQQTTWNSSDYGSIFTAPPMIDATNFNNTALWGIATVTPFVTTHTLNYTNKGTMDGSVGWEFDCGLPGYGRVWSAIFFNDNNGTVSALDSPGIFAQYLSQLQSFVLVSATNIVNKGMLTAGANGEIILTGSSINLSHSVGVEVTPIVGVGSPGTATNFSPDIAVYDEYWGTGSNLIVGGSPWSAPTLGAFSANGGIGMPCGVVNGSVQIGPLTPTAVDSVTNALGPWLLITTNKSMVTQSHLVYSNLYNQAVFVYTTNNVTGQIRFLPTFNPSNGFYTVAIQMATVLTNLVTAQLETDAVYFVDSFASGTNRGLAVNSLIDLYAQCNNQTFRPAAYSVSRTVPIEYAAGLSPGLGVPPDIFFYDPSSFANFIVPDGLYATYSFLLSNVAGDEPSVTNWPGHVRLYADNLNLNQTRVRAEGQIIVQATNLITSANAIMDCQNLSYKLGSTNGLLNFTNLAPFEVSRFNGTCSMVTALWTNLAVTVYTNFAFSNVVSGTMTNIVPYESDITNATQVYLSFTAVDGGGMETTVPVTVQDLVLHSTNIVVGDSVVASQSFLLDGLSATLVGDVTLSGVLQNWTYVNAPTLRYFTNNGVLTIPSNAHFGDDRPTNYLAFVNNGTILAGGQYINSVNLQVNSGGADFCYYGGFVGIAQTAQLTGAIIQSQSDMQFFANNLQLNQQSTLDSFGAVDLTVTNSLTDGGIGSGNTISCLNALNLYIKPTKGALLGTTVMSYAPQGAEVDQYWAGNNLGTSTSGYINNAALGALALIPEGSQATGYQPLFAFFGTTGNNGLYVSNLDLSMLTNYYNEVAIDPGITIYFVSAFLNPSVNTGAQTPEQFLNGMQFLDANGNPGGYMRWVGVSSLNKTKPTGYGTITGNYSTANGKFQLRVNNASGPTNFVIQASSDLKNWVPIYTNSGPFGVYTDPNAGAYPYRFYRSVPGH